MRQVVIGVDPHKRSNTALVLDDRERVLGRQRFANDRDGYRDLRRFAAAHRDRVWAVEGAAGVGLSLAQRLVADGERVLNVPAKLSARVRALGGGSGRKTDDTDAYAVAVAGLRGTRLAEVRQDDTITVLRLLCDRRRELVEQRIDSVNRLHRLLVELVPGGAAARLTCTKAKVLLAAVRPRDAVGKARKQLALEHLADLLAVDARLKEMKKRITAVLDEHGTSLTEIYGVGPVVAGTILGEVGDVRRFPSRHHFASYTGTAPIDASSGDATHHRLNRGGNRRLNHALHVTAVSQIRHPGPGQDYYRRKIAAGKSRLEALRCLKRRLSDVVYRQLIADIERQAETGPGGHSGAATKSSAADPTPTASSSDKSLPGPADRQANPVPTPAA
jgi:transposase